MRYLVLFVPFIFAYLLQDTPTASYVVSWTGSILILWLTLSGRIRPLPSDRPLIFQLFRPIVFTQIVFVAYTALSSIFFFLALMQGKISAVTLGGPEHLRSLTAEAQSYYVLAHASIATGLLIFMDYSGSRRYQLVGRHAAVRFLLAVSATFFGLSILAKSFLGGGELGLRLSQIAIVASVFSFALSLINRELTHIWINAIVFAANFVVALLSGWKEQVLIIILLFFAAIFPFYKRTTAVLALVTIGVFVAVMPAYTTMYRDLAWYGDVEERQAMAMAIEQIRSGRVDTRKSTEDFLTQRLSEIGLFVRYLDRVPEKRPFYGTQLLRQSAVNLIPRALWPEKPNTEQMVMERVYENGLFSRFSRISAKPQYVVDSYLSAGIAGVVIAGFIFGALASLISRLAERWFGGYTMGSGLIYAALFQIFWRGNAFEFFVGTLTWSLMVMYMLFRVGRYFRLLTPTPVGQQLRSAASFTDTLPISVVRPRNIAAAVGHRSSLR